MLEESKIWRRGQKDNTLSLSSVNTSGTDGCRASAEASSCLVEYS